MPYPAAMTSTVEAGGLARRALVGDLVAVAVPTAVGFGVHGTLGEAGRLVATVVAFAGAWVVVAGGFGLYDDERLVGGSWLRVLGAWVAAAPLGALARSLLLGRVTVVVAFVLVTIAVTAPVLVAWRLVLARRVRRFVDQPASP
ncbi:MAG TPA: DUF3054 family protein [Actinobacteria bacterium]|nr:DUF3054 family protein [Actinomycetota bacterium]